MCNLTLCNAADCNFAMQQGFSIHICNAAGIHFAVQQQDFPRKCDENLGERLCCKIPILGGKIA